MNHLSGTAPLANRYAAMRHGQSKANVRGIIVSRIETDRDGDYGLSEQGRQQALAAARDCGLPGDTVICSSDFARARQTAEIVREQLGAAPVMLAEALRERNFGAWEGTGAVNYARVWAADAADSAHPGGDVEPAAAVLDRVTAFVAELERRYRGRDVLLVSHGDTLQILEAGFARIDPSRHRSLPALGTAEIRPLRPADAEAAIPAAATRADSVPQVIIRDAEPSEYAVVGELRVTAYQSLGLLPEGSGYARTLRGFGFDGDCEVLVAVAETASGVLGTITLEPFGAASELARDATEADIRAFAVAPQAQGLGVGRTLLLAVIDSARKRGLRRLRLCTQPAMESARHLYETTGFSRTPKLDFEPVPGLTLRAYELTLPPAS
jgi:broad specificity phosphatase PhoE/GNAT superfamily N-acetyltransferase